MVKLPPKLEDAVKTIEDLINYLATNEGHLLCSNHVDSWEKIKFDLRRLQEIDKRHDGAW